MIGLLRDVPSHLHHLKLESIPALMIPAAGGSARDASHDEHAFLQSHRRPGVSQLETCLSLESLSELQKLELNLSLTSLWNHCRQEYEDAYAPDFEAVWFRHLGYGILGSRSTFGQPYKYLLWVDENNIEDDIRNGLASSQARAPGRNTEIIITGYGACVQERSPFA